MNSQKRASARQSISPVRQSGRATYAGVVRELGDEWVLFDFNHPLAGQPVTFEVRVIGVM